MTYSCMYKLGYKIEQVAVVAKGAEVVVVEERGTRGATSTRVIYTLSRFIIAQFAVFVNEQLKFP